MNIDSISRKINKIETAISLHEKTIIKGFVVVFLLIVFCGIFYLNLHTGYVSDDYMYQYTFDTGEPNDNTHLFRVNELIKSMSNHRKIWNGRIVAHGLLQIALKLPFKSFRLLNSIIFLLLGILIYVHCTFGRNKSKSLLVIVFGLIWFFVPSFGQTILWASGSASYLWCSCIILIMLLPYRIFAINQGKRNTVLYSVILFIFGVVAGCTNENTGGALVLLSIFYCIIYKIKKYKTPIYLYVGIIGEIIGVIILLTAPANKRVRSKTDIRGYIERFKIINKIFFEHFTILLVLMIFASAFCIIIHLYAKRINKQKKLNIVSIAIPVSYVLSGIASCLALVLSAEYPPRAMFVASVLFLVAFGYIYDNLVLSFDTLTKVFITLIMFSLMVESFDYNSRIVIKEWNQVQRGLQIIKEAAERGDESVDVPIVDQTGCKYDAFYDTRYIYEGDNGWVNGWLRYKYGVKVIGYYPIRD